MSETFVKTKSSFDQIPTSTVEKSKRRELAEQYFEWDKSVTAKLV